MTVKRPNSLFLVSSLISAVLLLFLSGSLYAQKVPIYKIDDLTKRIYNNSDTVYVVNFWATWCKPCVEELPGFEKINSENKAVKVILVCLDFKEDLKKRVVRFLKTNKIKTETILLDEINGDVFINKICEKWSGAIPATLITQKNKKRFEFYEKKLSYDFLKEKTTVN